MHNIIDAESYYQLEGFVAKLKQNANLGVQIILVSNTDWDARPVNDISSLKQIAKDKGVDYFEIGSDLRKDVNKLINVIGKELTNRLSLDLIRRNSRI